MAAKNTAERRVAADAPDSEHDEAQDALREELQAGPDRPVRITQHLPETDGGDYVYRGDVLQAQP